MKKVSNHKYQLFKNNKGILDELPEIRSITLNDYRKLYEDSINNELFNSIYSEHKKMIDDITTLFNLFTQMQSPIPPLFITSIVFLRV